MCPSVAAAVAKRNASRLTAATNRAAATEAANLAAKVAARQVGPCGKYGLPAHTVALITSGGRCGSPLAARQVLLDARAAAAAQAAPAEPEAEPEA